jgi:hypothetical protein
LTGKRFVLAGVFVPPFQDGNVFLLPRAKALG